MVALLALNDAISPVPRATRPIDGVLLLQLNIVPPTGPVKITGAVGVLLHTVWFSGCTTCGVGFTVIVNVIGVPLQVTPAFV